MCFDLKSWLFANYCACVHFSTIYVFFSVSILAAHRPKGHHSSDGDSQRSRPVPYKSTPRKALPEHMSDEDEERNTKNQLAKAGNYQTRYSPQYSRFRSPQHGVTRDLSTIMHRPKEAETEPRSKYQRIYARHYAHTGADLDDEADASERDDERRERRRFSQKQEL